VAFPKEIAGEAANCPHCQQPIILGRKSRAPLWTLTAFTCLCVLVTALVLWNTSRPKPSRALRPAEHSTTTFESRQQTSAAALQPPQPSEDDRAIEALCRAMYERANEHDFESLHQLTSADCKAVLTAAEIGEAFVHGNTSYKFIGMESVTYLDGAPHRLAKARIRRTLQQPTGESDGIREVKCIKEQEGWRTFRDIEWTQKLFTKFERSGLSDELRSDIRQFCLSDLFEKWPGEETAAFEQMYQLLHPGVKDVFPWRLAFAVTTNHAESFLLHVGFSIRNNAEQTWESTGLNLQLKSGGKIVLETVEFIPTLVPGAEVSRDSSFFLNGASQNATQFDLDVWYTLAGGEKCKLVSDVPINLRVQRLTDFVKCDIVRRSFDASKGLGGEDLLVARLDYRVTNFGKEPLKSVQLKFVWFSMTGELLDQTTESVVGFSDLPLAPQQTKAGFVHCGTGYALRRVPIKADIYLEDGERHWPVYRSVIVQ
jgi:hypothetical protein